MARPRTPVGEFGTIRSRRVEKSGTWRATTYVRLPTGKLVEVKATAGSEEKAKKLVKERARERVGLKTGGLINSETTVNALAKYYIDAERRSARTPIEVSTRKSLATQTLYGYELIIENWVKPLLGKLQLRELTTERIADVIDEIAVDFPTQAGKVRNVVSNLMKLAMRYDAITRNPVDGVPRVRTHRREVDILSADEIVILRAAVYNRQRKSNRGPKPNGILAAGFDVMLGSGLRIGECLALRRADVSLEDGTIDVTGTIVYDDEQGRHVRQPTTKTPSSERYLKLPPFAVEALRSRLEQGAGSDPDSPVFATRTVAFMTPTQYRNELRRVLATTTLRQSLKGESQIDRITPHKLRSTVATAIERERTLGDAAEVLGHSHTGITITSYIKENSEAVETIDVLQLVAEIAQTS